MTKLLHQIYTVPVFSIITVQYEGTMYVFSYFNPIHNVHILLTGGNETTTITTYPPGRFHCVKSMKQD